MKKSLIYIKTFQYPNVDWSSMCACMCMGGTNSDASSFHRNFLRFTHLFQTIPQNGATLIKTSYYALQPREQLRRASWYRNQSARGTSHSLQHPICRVHWNRQNHFDSRFRRPAEPRGAGKSTYGPAGLSTLSPLRGNKPHTTEGPHRGQARGAADAADRARPPPGAREPPPPQSAGRPRGARLSRSFAAGAQLDGPACPGTTYPKTPPSSRRRQAPQGASAGLVRGFMAPGGRQEAPRFAFRGPGGRPRAAGAGAAMQLTHQGQNRSGKHFSSGGGFPAYAQATCSRFYRCSESPAWFFPPANRSRSMAVVPGLVAAGACRQQGPESR